MVYFNLRVFATVRRWHLDCTSKKSITSHRCGRRALSTTALNANGSCVARKKITPFTCITHPHGSGQVQTCAPTYTCKCGLDADSVNANSLFFVVWAPFFDTHCGLLRYYAGVHMCAHEVRRARIHACTCVWVSRPQDPPYMTPVSYVYCAIPISALNHPDATLGTLAQVKRANQIRPNL
ncbi:hypothetical protein EGR_07032 [Echinococcus granulosus]|uniref:Uncharacterized protein n=1 Tax=Echinococcus granulosus TaxID=6210 RepID=W6UIZ1_ECHGR|nr:hypothetical protein EGR_07032 [Echinococcus granulosus]EUB58112.1 hypothetical protein EGR_07032 [Echinococcus granulosus]